MTEVQLAHHVHGAGRSLVLVHGFGGSSASWRTVTDQLAFDRSVVTYDHRGHGDSANTGDADTYTFETLAADLAVLIDRLRIDDFDLLGHSMGGLVAMLYTLDNPDRVRSLILLDTGGAPAPDGAALMEPAIDLVSVGGIAALVEAARPLYGTGEEAEATWAPVLADYQRLDPVAFVTLGRALTTYPSILDRLDTITIPTTVMVGEHDDLLRSAADELRAAIPGAELVVIPNAAHSPHLEATADWLAAVEAHFARIG